MRKNYHFISDPKQLDNEQIRQHQDFAGLLAAYDRQNNTEDQTLPTRWRPLRIAFATVAAIAAGLALLWVMRPGMTEATPSPEVLAQESAAFFAEKPAIQPVLPSVSVPEQEITVASSTGADIDLGAQARMRIPATAFIDAEGNTVTGAVQITYRTLDDQADLLVSGLPMEYTGTGNRFQLSAAGVVEVSAFQNGEQIQLAPDKTLELTLVESIELPQKQAVAQREVLYWGDEQGSWIAGQAHSYTMQTESLNSKNSEYAAQQEFLTAKEALAADMDKEKQQIVAELVLPAPPVAPEGGSGGRPSFELDLANDKAIQLEGALADNPAEVTAQTTWVVSEKSADFDLRALTVVWETITVAPINDQEYRMTFRSGDTSDEVIVRPLLSPEAYATAMEDYRKQLAQWNESKDSIEARRQERLSTLTARYATREDELEEDYLRQNTGSRSTSNGEPLRTEVVHTFRIPRLGIWSCMQPFTANHEVVIAGLTQENGEPVQNKVAYLIDRTENTVYRFHAGEQGALLRFREKPDSDFVICVALDEGRMAIVSNPNLNAKQPLVLDEQLSAGSVSQIKAALTADG